MHRKLCMSAHFSVHSILNIRMKSFLKKEFLKTDLTGCFSKPKFLKDFLVSYKDLIAGYEKKYKFGI